MSVGANNNTLMTVTWNDEPVYVKMIDQTKLPETLEYIICKNHYEICDAIRNLSIRGAPAIGVAGAMGLALCVHNHVSDSKNDLLSDLGSAYKNLVETRPTAVNLKWGLDKILDVSNGYETVSEIKENVVKMVKRMS